MNSVLSNIISIIGGLTAILGIIFACVQLWQIKINRKRQFEQARREKTVEMVMHYSKCINSETKSTEKIVANFSDEQCQDLYNGNAFRIDEKTKEQLCKICPEKAKCEKSKKHERKMCQDNHGNYCIKGNILYFLRGNIITYLNTLESVLLAWQLGIVEQNVIEEQFVFLDKKRQRERALETFRTIAGNGHSYPAIEKFYQHLDEDKRKKAQETLKDILN